MISKNDLTRILQEYIELYQLGLPINRIRMEELRNQALENLKGFPLVDNFYEDDVYNNLYREWHEMANKDSE